MARALVWIEAARPRTLPAALAPVVVGTALAAHDGAFHAAAALLALVGAVAIQVGTNYANDLSDHLRGADTPERLGPRRATQAGLVSPRTMALAAASAFLLALAVGVALVARAGWPVVLIGTSAILFGWLYTGGPRPLGYVGLGEALVLLYFGPVAVAGTHFVQSLVFSPTAAVAGLGPGLLSTALLVVNNLRDAGGDARAGKRTLAVRFGARFAKAEFAACLVGAMVVPGALVAAGAPRAILFASGACFLGIPALGEVVAARPGDRLLRALEGTGRLLVVYAAAFAAGWLL
jgi:1,4-dihydroxy-2-naphthoate octaprenyltransferase